MTREETRGRWRVALTCVILACAEEHDVTQLPGEKLEKLPPTTAEQTPIVFSSDRGQPGIWDLYVMAADGSNRRRLTQDGGFSVPLWSPEGDTIAFRHVAGLDVAVGMLALETNERVSLVEGEDPALWVAQLTWSEAGERLGYASKPADQATDFWEVSRTGGQLRRLLPAVEGTRDAVDICRVDGRIVYAWQPGESAGTHGSRVSADLWVVDGRDDTTPENLTEGRVYAPGQPRWSPDGTRVAFSGYAIGADGNVEGLTPHGVSVQPPDSELFMLDVLTRELTRLTNDGEDDFFPVWSPDGKDLIFSTGKDHIDEDIWKLSVDNPEDLVNLIDDRDDPSSDSMPSYFWGRSAPE